MKSETYMSAKITDEGRAEVVINGTADKLIALLEEEAVTVYKECEKHGHHVGMALFYLFLKDVAKEVFNIDL